MRARIEDAEVKVFPSMEENTPSIATLPRGSEIEFGGTKRKAGKQWVPITLSTGQQAYIPAETRIHVIRQGAVMDKVVELHSEPMAGSMVRQQLNKGSKISILEVVRDGGQDWVKVRDETGNEGFIQGATRIRLLVQKTKANGRRNMISGGMWLAAGLIMVFSEGTSTSGSGLSLLGFGAILFGVIIFASGLVQYLTASA
jgi:uncharacterized protein YgiM (DUF1202 family)